jgi:hypothetical protein
MYDSLKRTAVTTLALAIIIVVALPSGAGAQEKVRESYRAFAVAMGTTNPPIIPPGRTVTAQIVITRWSTDEERADILTQLIENGQEAMVKTLQKQEETGFVRITSPEANVSNFPSERLRYARAFPLEGGKRRIVLAMDRPISFAEAVYRPRWRDYDVTLIVMDIDAEGKGEGQCAVGVRLSVDQKKKALVIENFATEPVRLTRITKN